MLDFPLASFPWELISAGDSQGNRILIVQHLEKIVHVPAGPFAFGGNADFGTVFVAQEVECQAA